MVEDFRRSEPLLDLPMSILAVDVEVVEPHKYFRCSWTGIRHVILKQPTGRDKANSSSFLSKDARCYTLPMGCYGTIIKHATQQYAEGVELKQEMPADCSSMNT